MSLSSIVKDPEFMNLYIELHQSFKTRDKHGRYIRLIAALEQGRIDDLALQKAMMKLSESASFRRSMSVSVNQLHGDKAVEVEPKIGELAGKHELQPAVAASITLAFAAAEPSFVGVKEAAEILGWDARRVATYRSRGAFPEPIAELAMGPIWDKQQIENLKKR